MGSISRISLRRLRVPLHTPYRLSYRTFTEFEPFLVEIETADGQIALADGHISPGSSAETREGGWAHLAARLPRLIGLGPAEAKALMARDFEASKVATTAAVVALEMLEGEVLAEVSAPARLPLLAPIGATERADIEREVERGLAAGFGTFKVKVGKDLEGDLARLADIQSAVAGRAALRVDANRAYSREDAIAFARRLNPEGIVLFEQPCEADLWDDNAAVAAASDVPVMLDEPICTMADIARAAEIPGVGYCKVKLKRFGGLRALYDGIRAIQDAGMQAVLGDGLGSDLHAWCEAAVAARTIDNAGEFNGYLKMIDRLFSTPLHTEDATLHLEPGPCPALDPARVAAATTDHLEFCQP